MSKLKNSIVLICALFVICSASTQAQDLSEAVEAYDADDYTSALPIFQSLAKQDDDDAMWYLGKMYDNGWGVEQSDELAFNWFERSAKLGDADSQWEVGIMYEIGQWVNEDQKKAFEWYLKAAENGRFSAMNEVGTRYSEGNGVRESVKNAAKWYQKGAEGGHGGAQANYGVLFEFGNGVKKSVEQALYWYRLSAEQGTATGQAYLGEMYQSGTGVEENLAEARRLYELAAAQDNEYAIERLEEMGSEGRVIASQDNSSDGEMSAEEAAETFDAMLTQAQFVNAGKLVQEKNYAEAFKIYYKLATEKNNAKAMFNIGAMYESGWGVPQSLEEAMKWIKLGAEGGSPDAQFILGTYYIRGNAALPVDKVKGIEWIKEAARNGDEGAQQNLTQNGLTW